MISALSSKRSTPHQMLKKHKAFIHTYCRSLIPQSYKLFQARSLPHPEHKKFKGCGCHDNDHQLSSVNLMYRIILVTVVTGTSRQETPVILVTVITGSSRQETPVLLVTVITRSSRQESPVRPTYIPLSVSSLFWCAQHGWRQCRQWCHHCSRRRSGGWWACCWSLPPATGCCETICKDNKLH